MDKKTKTLKIIFWSAIVISICFTFYKTIIKQDFVIIDYTSEVEKKEVENLVSEEI